MAPHDLHRETTHGFPGRARLGAGLLVAAVLATLSARAEFVPLPEPTEKNPDPVTALLAKGTESLGGTVVAAQDTYFLVPEGAEGLLRSFVVDTGEGYDFYYQVVNTGKSGDVFRFEIAGGFQGLDVGVTFTNDLSKLDFGEFAKREEEKFGPYEPGSKPVFSATRDWLVPGTIHFQFSEKGSPSDEANVGPQDSSMFAVIRTNESKFFAVDLQINGVKDSAFVQSLAAVPEPGALPTIGAAVAALLSRRRRRISG